MVNENLTHRIRGNLIEHPSVPLRYVEAAFLIHQLEPSLVY